MFLSYRHFYGHGRYDLGRFSFNYRGYYRNNAAAKNENEAYLAHVATVAKNKSLSPKKMKGYKTAFDQ